MSPNGTLSYCDVNLSFLCFNVNGSLSEKLLDVEFITLLSLYDIIVLNECWINKCSVVELSGYNVFTKPRKKRGKAKRDSGGIVIFVKDKFKDGMELVDWAFEDGLIFFFFFFFFFH